MTKVAARCQETRFRLRKRKQTCKHSDRQRHVPPRPSNGTRETCATCSFPRVSGMKRGSASCPVGWGRRSPRARRCPQRRSPRSPSPRGRARGAGQSSRPCAAHSRTRRRLAAHLEGEHQGRLDQTRDATEAAPDVLGARTAQVGDDAFDVGAQTRRGAVAAHATYVVRITRTVWRGASGA